MRIAPQRLPALVHGQSAVPITSFSFNSQQRQQQQPQRLPTLDHGHPETVRQHLPPLQQQHQLNVPHGQQQQQRPVWGRRLQQTHVNVPPQFGQLQQTNIVAGRTPPGVVGRVKPSFASKPMQQDSLNQNPFIVPPANYHVVVSGAGNVEVNGTYEYVDMLNECTWFRKEGSLEGKQVHFHIFMCKSQGVETWWISATPIQSKPGDNYDIDFYYASCYRDYTNPLPNGTLYWQLCSGAHTIYPVPEILLKNRHQKAPNDTDPGACIIC